MTPSGYEEALKRHRELVGCTCVPATPALAKEPGSQLCIYRGAINGNGPGWTKGQALLRCAVTRYDCHWPSHGDQPQLSFVGGDGCSYPVFVAMGPLP